MAANPDKVLLDVAFVAAWLLALIPAAIHLQTGWIARRDRLFGVLTPRALTLYYEQFRSSEHPVKERPAAFKRLFATEHGRHHYYVPLALLALVAGVGLWLTARVLEVWLSLAPNRPGLPPVAVGSFLGGLTWVLGDQLRRLRNQDFTPHDVYGCVYRLLVSVPLGYGIAMIPALGPEGGVPLAFLLGTFPTGTLTTMARRIAAQRLGLGDTDDGAVTELAQLQGVGKGHAERFQQEGISTIVELAWADPIDLTIRTNFDLWFVVDCVSQALLWVYLGPKVLELSRYSLRGAMEARYLLMDLESKDEAARSAARSALDEAAGVLQMRSDSLLHTLEEIARDPYTEFLCDIWDEQPGA